MLVFSTPSVASSYPCWLIRWGIENLTQEQIKEYIKKATPEQLTTGKKCLQQMQKEKNK